MNPAPLRKIESLPESMDATRRSTSLSPQRDRGTSSIVKKERANLKVLYAEDNLVNQKVLSKVLNRAGINDVTIVDNGKKAVDIARTVKFDCIFMDVQMPVMGGMEATKLIAARDPTANIVFVTAHALDDFKKQAAAFGAAGYIAKPFRLVDIEDLLKRLGTSIFKNKRMSSAATAAAEGGGGAAAPAITPPEDRKDVRAGSPPESSGAPSSSRAPRRDSLSSGSSHHRSSRREFDSLSSGSSHHKPRRAFLHRQTSKEKVTPDRKLKVLYAEDNVINQKVMSRVLARAGIRDVTIVDNGKKAVKAALGGGGAGRRFDCIFMDMQMPVMDGMEATRLIVQGDPTAKVIFVSAHALDEYKSRATAVGAVRFISKPCRLADIEALLDDGEIFPNRGDEEERRRPSFTPQSIAATTTNSNGNWNDSQSSAFFSSQSTAGGFFSLADEDVSTSNNPASDEDDEDEEGEGGGREDGKDGRDGETEARVDDILRAEGGLFAPLYEK